MVEWASKPTTEVVEALNDEWSTFTNQFEEGSQRNDILGAIEPLVATLISRIVVTTETNKEVFSR